MIDAPPPTASPFRRFTMPPSPAQGRRQSPVFWATWTRLTKARHPKTTHDPAIANRPDLPAAGTAQLSDRHHPERSQSGFEPDSNGRVLANRLGIELELLAALYETLLIDSLPQRPLRADDLRDWHRRWLGSLYPWAGELRTLNVSKGGFHVRSSGTGAAPTGGVRTGMPAELHTVHGVGWRCAGRGDCDHPRRADPDPSVPRGQRSVSAATGRR